MRALFSTLLFLAIACVAFAQDTIVLTSNVFTPSTKTIFVGQTVVFRNQQGFHNVNGTKATFPDNPVSFGNSTAAAPWTYQFTFTTPGTYRFQCDPHAGEMQGTITVVNYPLYTIPVVTTENAAGVADSLNKRVEVRGIVYGGSLRTPGVQFTIIDRNNRGIGIFDAAKNFGYTVTQGDSIIVRGVIEQFNGLTQINADTIIRVSQNNTLIAPRVVTRLSDTTESQLIRINGLMLVTPSQWTNMGTGFNVNATNGTTVFQIRIDSDVNLFGQPAPTGKFDLIGIGSQFDNSSPFDSSFQIIPRSAADLLLTTSVLDATLAEGVKLYPNPVANVLMLENPSGFDRVRISNLAGQQLLEFKNVNTKAEFNVNQLATGIYTITLFRGNRAWALEFVKQ